ncbi:MAG: hypothetical protein DME08_07370 [Candidatus Rokuibacteriota bacterium]|nr:MAG: hypothetical protein DME08_07370 [Candidatus Rokubacteria bacterium]
MRTILHLPLPEMNARLHAAACLDAVQADLAVTLSGVDVTDGKERARNEDRDAQRDAGPDFAHVDVAGVGPGRNRAELAVRGRRHADDPRHRRQRNFRARRIAGHAARPVDARDDDRLLLDEVAEIGEVPGEHLPAPLARLDVQHFDVQDVARLGVAHVHRPGEGMHARPVVADERGTLGIDLVVVGARRVEHDHVTVGGLGPRRQVAVPAVVLLGSPQLEPRHAVSSVVDLPSSALITSAAFYAQEARDDLPIGRRGSAHDPRRAGVGCRARILQAPSEIRIGLLAPLTGPIAKSGVDSVRGHELFWEQQGYKMAGRPVKVLVADTGCNPDNAITHARRLVHAEKVHFIIGPLCGHEGPAVAQVSRETGVPVLVSIAGADELTKWKRVPSVIRTGFSASQTSHPFGAYAYTDLGCRNATFIGQDYTFGHENTLGAVATFKQAGGKVAKIFWSPIGTTDYGPILGGIPQDTDCVLPTVVGTDRLRLLEQWYDFGYDRKYKIHGNYWLLADVLSEASERAVGLIGHSLHYAEGLETPEMKAFIDAFVKRYKYIPAYFAEATYTSALWAKVAAESIQGKVEDREAFLAAVRKAKFTAPRGPIRLDEYDNPVQNVYISKVVKMKHPTLGEVKVNVPIKTYENVSQFWTWSPQEYMARGPYQR